MFEKKKEDNPEMTDKQIYESLTGTAPVPVKGNRRVCEDLLEGADFWWIKKEGTSSYFSLQYPIFRAAILKSKEIFEAMELLMQKYQERAIPHNGVEEAAEEIEALLSGPHKAVKPAHVSKILSNHK